MKKILIFAHLAMSSIAIFTAAPTTTPAVQTPKEPTYVKSSYSFNTFHIHNLGTKPVKLNSISVHFKIGTEIQVSELPYKKNIKQGKIAKIANAKIQFNELATTPINYLGVFEINVNNNQTIKISNDHNIYLTNQGDVWKETTKPKAVAPQAKNVSAKTITPAPKTDEATPKTTVPAAKTATLKAAAVVVKNKAKNLQPKSRSAKAINTATTPKSAVIKPETPKS